jgi:hypothetical protein
MEIKAPTVHSSLQQSSALAIVSRRAHCTGRGCFAEWLPRFALWTEVQSRVIIAKHFLWVSTNHILDESHLSNQQHHRAAHQKTR